MGEEVTGRVVLRDAMNFSAHSGSGHSFELDSDKQAGASPMEAMLTSLAACSAMDVISILRKKRQAVVSFEVTVHGTRASDYPTVYTDIQLEYIVRGTNIDRAAVEHAVELSRDRYCPIWAMLGRGGVKINWACRIESVAD